MKSAILESLEQFSIKKRKNVYNDKILKILKI